MYQPCLRAGWSLHKQRTCGKPNAESLANDDMGLFELRYCFMGITKA